MHRLLIAALLLPFICNAQIPKPQPNTYINDYTSHLSADQVNDLNQQFRQLETTTGVQMAAVLINDLPPDMTIEDYARDIGNTWKVGTAHNGLVYVAVLNIRRQRLEVAENLEGNMPDVTAFEIIETLKDNLRQENYYGALSLLVTQVADHLGTQLYVDSNESENDYQQFKSLPNQQLPESDFDKEEEKYSFYGNIALIIIFLGATGFCVWAYRYRKKYIALYTVNGVYTGIGSAYYTGPGSNDSEDSGGGFGGFGGGGGGGFSGGGASGGW